MYLEIKDMKKSFGSGESYNQVLKGITTNIEQGQMCVIQGNSGSGKTTLIKAKLHRRIRYYGFWFSQSRWQ